MRLPLAIVVLSLVACSQNNVTTPDPVVNTRTFDSYVIAPNVAGNPPTANIGELHNLKAYIRFRSSLEGLTSDDVTAASSWTNSNPAVAGGRVEGCNPSSTVSMCLRLIGASRGVTSITATYQGHTANYTLTVQ